MPLVDARTITFTKTSPYTVCTYISKHPGIVLLDVRSKEEFEGKASPDYGTLQNAINIPIDELEGRLPELDSLKDKAILVYCSHSHRSSRVSYLLVRHGFHKVVNLAGGLIELDDASCKK